MASARIFYNGAIEVLRDPSPAVPGQPVRPVRRGPVVEAVRGRGDGSAVPPVAVDPDRRGRRPVGPGGPGGPRGTARAARVRGAPAAAAHLPPPPTPAGAVRHGLLTGIAASSRGRRSSRPVRLAHDLQAQGEAVAGPRVVRTAGRRSRPASPRPRPRQGEAHPGQPARVTLQPCDLRGKVAASAEVVPATAAIVTEGPDLDAGRGRA